MALTIVNAKQTEQTEPFGIPPDVWEVFPRRLRSELARYQTELFRVEELRLRCGRQTSLTVNRRNLLLNCVLSRDEMNEVVHEICDRSLYAYRDSIAQGYLTLSNGVRVGLCGRASVENGTIVGVYDISGLNFRIPNFFRLTEDPVCRWIRERNGDGGALIYAPPGEGKTTLLRSIAKRLSGGSNPLRTVVIDTRGELEAALKEPSLCLDCLTGYPRAQGIEIAARTMNAQVIVCDEIGEKREAEAMVAVQNCGVPFVASAHASHVDGLLRRSGLRRLHEARVFGIYVGIVRCAGGGDFRYTVTEWEEANDRLQAGRSFAFDCQRNSGSTSIESGGG